MSTTSSTAAPTANLVVPGLASGFDWQTLVTQLIAVESEPVTQLQSQQTNIQTQSGAYTQIGSLLGTLSTDTKALLDPTLFAARQASLSDSSVATASADSTTPLGSFAFNFTQLASSAIQEGAANTAQSLNATSNVSSLVLGNASFVTPISAGTFSVDGQTITIATTDTLQSVFDQINSATGGVVSGSYDPTTDTISLSSNNSSPVVLGSATDTSNFLQAAKLYNNGTPTVTSTSALGGVQLNASLSGANLKTAVTDGGSGNGAMVINGVTINYNAANDSISDILARINNSGAGVTATYNTIDDRFELTDQNTGDIGISLSDVTGNFLAATGLSAAGGGALQRGKNLLYTINGGTTMTSLSNTVTQDSSGLPGLTVTALKQNVSTTVTVGSNTSQISSAISSFVSDYNAVQNYISTQVATTTDPTSGAVTPGLLTGDNDIEGMETTLRQLATVTPPGLSGVIKSLTSLGIVSNGTDNTLAISDPTKLSNALTSNLGAVQSLFTDPTNGLATQLENYLTHVTGTSGVLATKEASFKQQSTNIGSSITAMQKRISSDQTTLTNEFVAMETARSQINLQQQYLTSAFGGGSSSSSSGG